MHVFKPMGKRLTSIDYNNIPNLAESTMSMMASDIRRDVDGTSLPIELWRAVESLNNKLLPMIHTT